MEALLDIKEIAEKLRVKESTLRAWVFQRRIPIVRIGRLVRFNPSEIEKWLRGQDHSR
jgi:excisionase family DNA binding protein